MLVEGRAPRLDASTFWYSCLCGVSIAVCMFANLMALKEGAVVLVQVFSMAGLLVPCITGIFCFRSRFRFFSYWELVY